MERKANWIAKLPLGLIAALMLGAAVAFFCIAMPGEMLERIVAATRLPDILPAAAPPLGNVARLLVAGSAGLSALLLVWACFALIGRPRIPRDPDVDTEYEPDFGEDLRTAEYEPAPRRPLLAGTELGLPFDLTDPLPSPTKPEPAVLEPIAPEPPPLELATPKPAPEPLFTQSKESVAALMARLESGLMRRSARQPAATVTPLKPAPEDSTELQPEDPLRSALEELQRMARGGR